VREGPTTVNTSLNDIHKGSRQFGHLSNRPQPINNSFPLGQMNDFATTATLRKKKNNKE